MEDVFPIKIGDIPASYVSLPEGSLRRFFFLKLKVLILTFPKRLPREDPKVFHYKQSSGSFVG